jgi:flagellar motor switch protein FliN/FliY
MADATTAEAQPETETQTPAPQPADAAPAEVAASDSPAQAPGVDTVNNDSPVVEASEAAFPQAPQRDVRGAGGQIGILLDTRMPITVTLGQIEISIKDLLSLSAGAVLKLDKQVGEPAELYLRGIKFATGHLVVVGDQLGVKIHEIIPAVADGAGAN